MNVTQRAVHDWEDDAFTFHDWYDLRIYVCPYCAKRHTAIVQTRGPKSMRTAHKPFYACGDNETARFVVFKTPTQGTLL